MNWSVAEDIVDDNKFKTFVSVIGKGGEQITRLQAETGCKVQIAPGNAGYVDKCEDIVRFFINVLRRAQWSS